MESSIRANVIVAIVTVAVIAGSGAALRVRDADAHAAEPGTAERIRSAARESADSVATHVAAAQRLLAWLEDRETGSSAALLADVRELTRPYRLPLLLTSPDDVNDVDVPSRNLAAAELDVIRAYQDLNVALDRHLPRGVWHHIHSLDTGPHTIDFRGALRSLYEEGLEYPIRSVVRTLAAEQQLLSRIAADTTAEKATQ